jgi:acyl-coenzyme A synthetase/AMP-(fatty) acid ligase
MPFDYHQIWSAWDPWAGIPAEYNLGDALTAGQVRAGRGDVSALVWENASGAARSFTYRQLDALSSRLASSLARLGVKRGDRVFLRLPNVPEFYIAALAIAKLGGVFIPSSTQFRTSEVEYRLRDSGAVAAITTTGLIEAVDQASAVCPDLKHIVAVDYPPASGGPDMAYTQFQKLLDEGSEAFAPAATRHDDMAFIAYTSGTTGDPKGVVHYQRYPIAYEGLVHYWHDYRPNDVVACPSELGWLLPVASTFLYALAKGLTVVLFDPLGGKFDPERWCGLFVRARLIVSEAQIVTESLLLRIPLRGQCELLCCCRKILSLTAQQSDIVVSSANNLLVIGFAALQFLFSPCVQIIRVGAARIPGTRL